MVAEVDREGEHSFERYVEIQGKMGICFYPKNCWMAIAHVPPIDYGPPIYIMQRDDDDDQIEDLA